VRMGVKDANDAGILDTLPEYDATIKQTIAGKGPAWFRYNFDGYGETDAGANYSGAGKGRLWPIFTAERGMYEIAKAGNVGSMGTSYLNTLRTLSTPEGFIPEQIWNNSTTLYGGWTVNTPAPYVPGTPSKSIAPLSWAMGEYINLMASIAQNKIADLPVHTCSRYNNCLAPLTAGQARVRFNANATTVFGENVYVVGNTPELGNWGHRLGRASGPPCLPGVV
jgi:glucoamylase